MDSLLCANKHALGPYGLNASPKTLVISYAIESTTRGPGSPPLKPEFSAEIRPGFVWFARLCLEIYESIFFTHSPERRTFLSLFLPTQWIIFLLVWVKSSLYYCDTQHTAIEDSEWCHFNLFSCLSDVSVIPHPLQFIYSSTLFIQRIYFKSQRSTVKL